MFQNEHIIFFARCSAHLSNRSHECVSVDLSMNDPYHRKTVLECANFPIVVSADFLTLQWENANPSFLINSPNSKFSLQFIAGQIEEIDENQKGDALVLSNLISCSSSNVFFGTNRLPRPMLNHGRGE
jgi:hypothetical protein